MVPLPDPIYDDHGDLGWLEFLNGFPAYAPWKCISRLASRSTEVQQNATTGADQEAYGEGWAWLEIPRRKISPVSFTRFSQQPRPSCAARLQPGIVVGTTVLLRSCLPVSAYLGGGQEIVQTARLARLWLQGAKLSFRALQRYLQDSAPCIKQLPWTLIVTVGLHCASVQLRARPEGSWPRSPKSFGLRRFDHVGAFCRVAKPPEEVPGRRLLGDSLADLALFSRRRAKPAKKQRVLQAETPSWKRSCRQISPSLQQLACTLCSTIERIARRAKTSSRKSRQALGSD